MNTDWNTAIEFVLKAEGGAEGELVPNDKGGYTKFGISTAANPDIDIPNLTEDGAKALYKERYWLPCKCDELPTPLAIAVFDAAVNQGVGMATRMLQIALNVAVDGVIGERTIAAAFKSGPIAVRRFMAQRMARYIRIISKDHTQEVFADNWSNRLMKLAQVVFAEGPKESNV